MRKSTNLCFLQSVILFSSVLFASQIRAKEIHVSRTDGINALSGRGTEAAPYKSISYLFTSHVGVGKLVSPNDIIIVHKGVYRETINVTVDNVTIRPFENDKVIVSGANWYGANSWSPDATRTGVFKLTLNKNQVQTDFTQLFVNGSHQQIARFPNNTTPFKDYIEGRNREMMNPLNQSSGFAILLNASKPAGLNATAQVTFSDHEGTPPLPDVTFTNEAIVRGFIGKLRNNIFSSSGDLGQVTRAGERLVTFKSFQTQGNSWGKEPAYSQPEGFGYIMDLTVLDEEGEWFYRKNENTLYYKPFDGTVTGKNFEIQRREFVLKVNADNLKVENIDFKVGEVELKNSQNTSFDKCTFTYLSPYQYRRSYGVFRQGIVLDNADNTSFESCYIAHTWGSGIIVRDNSENTKINNCFIEDIGWMGQFTVALENNGNNTEITHNTFGKASRFHIRTTESVHMKILDNDFYQAMSMGEDAGSIMFTSTGKSAQLNMQDTEIAYNKLHDLEGIPAYDTSPGYKRQKVVGLYLEDVDNYTVHHNLVYNITGGSYVSKRLKNNGQPQDTEHKGEIAYLGPRNRNVTRKMHYFNNTFWNYKYLLTFWHRTADGKVNDMVLKNNLIQKGALNSVSNIDETDLPTFSSEVAKPPLEYTITVDKNFEVAAASNHYTDASKNDLRLISSSPYNNGGEIITGITTENNPTIGAWEGNTDESKNRVFNAGSNITKSTFDNTLNIDIVRNNTESKTKTYPNPFKEQINLISTRAINEIIFRNMNGVIILKQSQFNDNNQIKMDTSRLSAGPYFLEINLINGQKEIRRVIKL